MACQLNRSSTLLFVSVFTIHKAHRRTNLERRLGNSAQVDNLSLNVPYIAIPIVLNLEARKSERRARGLCRMVQVNFKEMSK